jgi:hypothetical protein
MTFKPNTPTEVHPTIRMEHGQLCLNVSHVSRFGVAVHQLLDIEAIGEP